MKSTVNSGVVREQVLEEAAAWLVECQAGSLDAEERKTLDAWLRVSPEHVQAYLSLLPLWESSAQLDSAGQPDLESLIALAGRTATNVVSIGAGAVRAAPAEVRTDRSADEATVSERFSLGRRFITGAMAASVLIGLAAGAWLFSQRNTYATGVGAQRAISLPDGSVVELDTRSSVRIGYTRGSRTVDLLEGQALFRVEHDAARPFVVVSGPVRVRAVGTQFDVYRKRDSTIVTVLQGRVAVGVGNANPGEAVRADSTTELAVSAGEQLKMSTQEIAHQRPAALTVDTSNAVAWRQHRLVFSATPLADVAAEFNRYNTRPLRLDSAEIGALRINGVFSSTDLGTLLAFLREQPGVMVIEGEKEVHIARR